ncbi:hypothetical protein JCM39068_25110 [Desulfocastanea catecholica]
MAIAPPGIVFSGFSSGAFWLIFGGLILGVGINVTGLGTRIAGKAAHHLNQSYARLIAGLVFFGALFGLLMPSALGRVILLVPIAMNMADHFGLQKGRRRGGFRHYCRCTDDKAGSRPYFILSPSKI